MPPSKHRSVAGPMAGLIAIGCAQGCSTTQAPADASAVATTIEVVPAAEIEWSALNPARGNQGPRAADLWGDRTGPGGTGFLVRFAEGFSSPPHIHNVTYRGMVIEGLVHNDDPDAAHLWMPTGSYWTQPAGEVHITSAKGDGRLAYIEIEQGPYLVRPSGEASDNGERAVNIHADNIVWLDASTTSRITLANGTPPSQGPMLSFLWGDPQDGEPSGSLVRIPADASVDLHNQGPSIRIVVIEGEITLDQSTPVRLAPGSYVGIIDQPGSTLSWTAADQTTLYVRAAGAFHVSTPR